MEACNAAVFSWVVVFAQAEISECLKREPAPRVGALEDDPEYKLVVASNELIQVRGGELQQLVGGCTFATNALTWTDTAVIFWWGKRERKGAL